MWMDILCMLCLGKEKFKYFIFTPNRTIQYIAQEWRSIYLEHDDMIYRIFVSKTRKISALVKTIIYIRHIFFYLDHQLMTLIQILSTALVHSFKKGRNLWMYCCSTHLWILNHPEKIPLEIFYLHMSPIPQAKVKEQSLRSEHAWSSTTFSHYNRNLFWDYVIKERISSCTKMKSIP